MDKKIGDFQTVKGAGSDIRVLYDHKSLSMVYVTIYSKEYGTLLRFKPIGDLNLIVFPLYKDWKEVNSVLMSIGVYADAAQEKRRNREFIDYLRIVICGAGGHIQHLDCNTFKEIRDLVLLEAI